MKKLLFLLTLPLWGQFTMGPPTAPATVQVGVPFNMTIPVGGNAEAGYQFTLALPADAVNVSVGTGSMAFAANKQADCNPGIAGICLIYGINTTLVQPGALAVVTMTLTSMGTHNNVCFAAPLAVDLNGAKAVLTPGNFCVSVSVLPSLCDPNGDGQINSADVTLIASWANGKVNVPAGQTCDKNGDLKCDISDVEIIIKAARGEACIAQ